MNLKGCGRTQSLPKALWKFFLRFLFCSTDLNYKLRDTSSGQNLTMSCQWPGNLGTENVKYDKMLNWKTLNRNYAVLVRIHYYWAHTFIFNLQLISSQKKVFINMMRCMWNPFRRNTIHKQKVSELMP